MELVRCLLTGFFFFLFFFFFLSDSWNLAENLVKSSSVSSSDAC
jgi:hypothetical protein